MCNDQLYSKIYENRCFSPKNNVHTTLYSLKPPLSACTLLSSKISCASKYTIDIHKLLVTNTSLVQMLGFVRFITCKGFFMQLYNVLDTSY